jgi:hypothetical protein
MIALWLVSLAWAEAPNGPLVLSAELRSLIATRRNGGPSDPENAEPLAADKVRVMIRFDQAPTSAALSSLSGQAWSFATLNGEPVHSGLTYAASVPWESLPELAGVPNVVRIELGRSLGLMPPVDISADWIGVDVVRERPAILGSPALAHGTLVVDFDTGVDLAQPGFFHTDGGLYDWEDTDGDGELTPGVDQVQVDGSWGVLELLQGSLLDAYGRDSTAAWGYGMGLEPDLDLLYVDVDGNGMRSHYSDELAPGMGEPTFYVEDLDRDGIVTPGEWLVRVDTPKVAWVWTAAGGLRERGVDLSQAPADPHGHGTGVASILHGGHPGLSSLAPMAPGAELASFSYYLETETFDWVTAIETARTLNPDVMLFEVGDFTAEFADGSSLFEQAVTESAQDAATVCPAGNVGANGKHGAASLTANGAWAGLYVYGPSYGYNVTYAYMTLTWQGSVDVQLQFQGDGTSDKPIDIPIDGDWVNDSANNWVRATSDASTRGSKLLLIEWSNWDGANYRTLEGVAYLGVIPSGNADFHLWTSDNGSSWSGGVVNWDPSWGWGDQYSWATPVSSASVPSTADACITLGSFQTRNAVYYDDESAHPDGPLSDFSGRGPRIDGADVVDVVAPGHYDIRALDALANGPANEWSFFGGTSAAGPHVASAAAILLAVNPQASHEQVEQALQSRAERDSTTGDGPYDDDWGYGRLRVDDALLAIDETPPSFEVLAKQSPYTPGRRLWVVPGESLLEAPECTAGSDAVALSDVGGGVWFGVAGDGELSCTGVDLAGNAGGETVVLIE